jgi:hypothetical protein
MLELVCFHFFNLNCESTSNKTRSTKLPRIAIEMDTGYRCPNFIQFLSTFPTDLENDGIVFAFPGAGLHIYIYIYYIIMYT